MWVEFLVTSFVVVIAPGTGVIYTVGAGLARGFWASSTAAAGCTAGILPHVAAAILGVAALLQASAFAFQVFKLLGVIYLFYLAWTTLQDRGALTVLPESAETSLFRIARTGFLINILNPKLSIFFLAFLPQFLPLDTDPPLGQMLAMSVIFMTMTFAVFVVYGAFASAVRQHIVTKPNVLAWMRRGFATAFVLLGLRLLFERA